MKRFLGKEAAMAWLLIIGMKVPTRLFVRPAFDSYRRGSLNLSARLSHQWGDDVSVKQQEYQGRAINHILFKKQGIGLAYVRIRDLLIITPESLGKNLEEVVDVYEHRHEPLQVDPSINFVRQNAYPSGDGLVFVNLNLFSDLWRGEMDSRLTPLGYQTAAFPVYGLSYMPGKVSKYKIMVGLDEKHMSSGMRKVFSCPAVANDSLKLVPVNAIAYNWGGCYDFEQSWAAAKERLEENPGIGP